MTKYIILITCFISITELPTYAQDTKPAILHTAVSSGISSSQLIQLKASVKIEGIKLDKNTKIEFDSDAILTTPSIITRSGENALIELIKEYPVANIDENPFVGMKILLKPRYDFITGKIINSGKFVLSQAEVIGRGELKDGTEVISHDFRAWSKHWNGIGDQNLTLKIDEHTSLKILIHWQLIDPTGRIIKVKPLKPEKSQ